ncbi:MAG: DASS family sodium-coupled anion symporter [Saprospiraceae bacterium]|mgnify:CR=1 FL=1
MSSKRIGLFLGPIAFLILLFIPNPAGLNTEAWKVLAIAVFMLIWWITEAVPLAVAALLPLLLLPLLGVQPLGENGYPAGIDQAFKMGDASAPYASPIVFLFMGGFMIALAMERWSLHRRIALNIVKITGTNADGIVLGFMLATAALSMWISNTATTVLMLPIALSVITLLLKDTENIMDKGKQNFALSMMLGIAYAANIGGTATIIGTPPNVVFAGIMETQFDVQVSFFQWIIFGLPFAVILLGITFFLIVKLMHPNKLGEFEGAQEIIAQEVDDLGPISTGEKRTLLVFSITALLWIFRAPISNLLPEAVDLSDAGIAILGTVLMFIVPVNFDKHEFVLSWRDTEKLPWGILLLFGGGLSLANALNETGLIKLIGDQFAGMGEVGFLVIIGLAAVSLFLTEIMSNVALVVVFLPVVGAIALGADLNLLQVCIPVTLAASCAFMLPMSTPPNAIVFASGHLNVAQMVRVGLVLNIITIILIGVVAEWILPLLFSM